MYFEAKQTNDMVTRGMPHGIMKNQVWHVPLEFSAWVTYHLDVRHEWSVGDTWKPCVTPQNKVTPI